MDAPNPAQFLMKITTRYKTLVFTKIPIRISKYGDKRYEERIKRGEEIACFESMSENLPNSVQKVMTSTDTPILFRTNWGRTNLRGQDIEIKRIRITITEEDI